MNDINSVVIIGRMARDAELRYTPSGTAVASFSVACNYSYGSGDSKKEQASYFDCVAWAKLGEIVTEYAKKGQQVAIEGRLQQRRWEDHDGKKRSKIEIVVENFQMVGGRKDGDSKPQGTADKVKDSFSGVEANPFTDDDVPF